MRYMLLALVLVCSVCSGQTISVLSSGGVFELHAGRVVEQDYLLTRGQPVEFSVTGPAPIRVFSRLLWHDEAGPAQAYVIALQTGRDARQETLQAQKSNSATALGNKAFAKWRSFYLKVPSGSTVCRLELVSGAADTAAVRFTSEEPPPWKDIIPGPGIPALTLREDSTKLTYYRIASDDRVEVSVVGPVRLAVVVRALFAKGTSGKQKFVLTIADNGIVTASETFEVLRSRRAKLQPGSGGVASVARRVRLDLPEGEHNLAIQFAGGVFKYGLVRVMTRPKGS